MPKIDVSAVPVVKGTGYPPEFDVYSADRLRQRLAEAGMLTEFGVNLVRLPPGNWSGQRHWHSHEDEFVYVIDGEVVLIEDGLESPLQAGDCAAFPSGIANGHHLVNRSNNVAVYLEIGSRNPDDLATCSDVNMTIANSDGRFRRKDGTAYDGVERRASAPESRECSTARVNSP